MCGTADASTPISRSMFPIGGPAVESRRRYYWQVRVWDPQGQASTYSQTSWWEMGLLSSAGLESQMDHARHATRARRL